MKQIGNYIIYRKDVCEITDIKHNHIKEKDYYTLVPLEDKSLKIDVPTDTKEEYLRDLMSKEEVEQIINKIPTIKPITKDEKLLENEYKLLLSSRTPEDLIKIIKITYLRNKIRLDSKKKISDKDNHYFELAEKYLYNEIRIVLEMNYEETKQYIINRVVEIKDQKKNDE